MPSYCNSYGFKGGFAAIAAAISWCLVEKGSCKVSIASHITDAFMANHFQMFHYIAIITGVVLFVLNFVNFAEILYEIKSLFNLAVFGIIASGAMMLYATDTAFHMSSAFSFVRTY